MKHPAVLIRRRALFGLAAALIVLAAATAFSMRWKGAETTENNISDLEAALESDFGNSFARLSSTGVDAAKNEEYVVTLSREKQSRGVVTVCDSQGQRLLDLHCNTGLPYAVELSEDCFYVLLTADDGSELRCLSLEDGSELWRYESAQAVCDILPLDGGGLCVLGLDSAAALDAEGKTVYSYEYESEPLRWGLVDGTAVVECGEGRVELYAEGAEVYNED